MMNEGATTTAAAEGVPAGLAFEKVTCTRCGGSGHHSYCQRYGTTCFKCAGRKFTYTKRGLAAKIYFENLLSVPAKDLKPGMKVSTLVISEGGDLIGSKWAVVTDIEDNTETKRGGFVIDGQTVYEGLNVVTDSLISVGIKPETMYRVAASREVKQEAIRKAIEYQDTLTKAGTPIKIKRSGRSSVKERL